MTTTFFVPSQFYRREFDPVSEPDPVVTRHAEHIDTIYKEKGGALAVTELAKVMADPDLTAPQRTALWRQLQPMTDEVANQLGRYARRTDLPKSGASGASLGIDDQQEYQLTLAQFAAALQKGDLAQAQRLAGVVLSAAPAAPVSNGGVDELGLLGDGLRTIGSNGSVLREAVIAQLRVEKPANAPQGSELAQPPDVRLATVGSLIPTASAPYKVPEGSDPAATRAYSDWAVQQAEDSRKLADELGKPFEKGTKPEDDPVAWEMYMMRVSAAKADQARVDVAIAAELRTVYGGDPKNKAATERLAREIAARYRSNGPEAASRMQKSIDRALQIVTTETRQQRNTDDKLYALHRADDKLNALMMDRQAGKLVSGQAITNARDAFASSRRELLAAVGQEIDVEIPTVQGPRLIKEDPLMVAANRVGGRYVDDLELQAALDAEVILRQAMLLSKPDDRMRALGRLMPRTLDPTTRAIVMSDPRGQGIVDDYVTWAADQVTGAYNNAAKSYDGYEHSADYEQRLFEGTPPALAATQKLLELTDTNRYSFMKPEIVARIFGELRQPGADGKPSTMDRVLDDLGLSGKWHRVLLGKDQPRGGDSLSEFPTYNTVVKNLSLAMDNMGRAQDVGTGRYPPTIETEVVWLGRRFAEMAPQLPRLGQRAVDTPPFPSRLDAGFKLAASEGSVILALETARQLTRPDAPKFDFEPYPGWDRNAQANLIVKAVCEGIDTFNTQSKKLFEDANKHMAPVSSPIARFGTNMTDEQLQAAVTAVFRDGPNGEKLYHQMLKDREAIDLRGYQLVRLGETVSFYRQPLAHLGEYRAVVKSRDGMLDSKENISMIMLSNTATLAIGAKTAMNMLSGGERAHGSQMPQKYGWLGQASDFAEYWAETYVLQKRDARAVSGTREYSTWADPENRVAGYSMPPAMREAREKTYNPGEAREGKYDYGRAGIYRRYSHMPFIQEANYAASRLGRFPLAGAAVWGGGGYAQAKLWNYIHNDVGMNKGEEWRKPFLEGTVGGFAAFHLLEAGVAVSRVGADGWYAMKSAGRLSSFEQHAPLLYQQFDSAIAREEAWARFSVTGTKGLTASLAGLMAVASIWDISGVVYRVQDGNVEHQGVWGSKWWKTGTHAVNATSDLLLLRLQVREFAKRAVPGMVEAGMTDGLLTNGAKSLSASRLLSWAGSRALTANPIGFWVNVAYLGTTAVNWVVDQHRYIADLEQYDNVFLRGAGVNQPQADLLKQHAFWTGDGKGDGLALSYQAVGGDPARFVEYLNAQDPGKLRAAIDAMGELPEHIQQPGNQPQLPVAPEYYLSLPRNGNSAANDSRFVFNEQAGRFEDAYTHMYYHEGKWLYAGPKDAGPGAQQLLSFDPVTRKVTKTDGLRTWEEQILASGLRDEDPSTAYLALPDDPTRVDLSKFPTVRFNAEKNRYEDSVTGLYFDVEKNKDAKLKSWRREDDIGDMGYYYYPTQQSSTYYWPMGHRSTDMHPVGVQGARAYLQAHDMMPPLA